MGAPGCSSITGNAAASPCRGGGARRRLPYLHEFLAPRETLVLWGGVKNTSTFRKMAEEERFERWQPIDGLAPKMFLDAMHDDREGFRLILKALDPKFRELRILFDAPLCHRGTQEKYLLRTIYEANSIYPWPIFIVHNSRYARWFYAQATDAIDKDGHHYHIAAMDQIVDVLSARPPILSWLNDV